MKMQDTKNQLRWKLGFRFGVIITAIICVVISYSLSSSECSVCKTVKDLLLGIAGSALVWSIIELFDFVVNIFDEYKNQRDKFIEKREKFCSDLCSLLNGRESQDIDCIKVYSVVSDFQQIISQTPFCEPIYAISNEFIAIYNYVNRLYWKLSGLKYRYVSNQNAEANCNVKKEMYDTLVEISTSHQEFTRFVQDNHNIDNEYERLSKIEVNCEPLPIPSHIVNFGADGNLGTTIKFFNFEPGTMKHRTLRISKMFDEIDKTTPSILIVFSLMFCSIKPYD